MSQALKDLMKTFKRPSSVIGAVERHMLGLKGDGHERRKYCFHPSSIGKGCARRLQYEFLEFPGEKRVIKPTTQLIFDTGHALQEVYVKHMIGAGIFVREDIERAMCNPEFLIYGHADAYDPTKGFGVDMKTTRDPVPYWDNGREEVPFKDMVKPHDGYVWQMQSYMACDDNAEAFAIIYFNKNDQTLKEFLIERDEYKIMHIKDMITEILEANQRRELVDRPDHAQPNKSPCTFCPYKQHCWNDLASNDGLWTVQDEIEAGIIDLATGKRTVQELGGNA